jgi:hypothetical protein
MKRERAPELLQGRGHRMRIRVGQLVAIPRALLLFVLLCLTPSEVARIACVASYFCEEALSLHFWNGVLRWPSGWLSLPRTDPFQSYMVRVFRVDLLFMARFLGRYFPRRREDEQDTQQNLALGRFFKRGLSLFELFEFSRLRSDLFQRVYELNTPRFIWSGGQLGSHGGHANSTVAQLASHGGEAFSIIERRVVLFREPIREDVHRTFVHRTLGHRRADRGRMMFFSDWDTYQFH